MANTITCPKCNHEFQPTDAFRDEVQRELNNKAKEWQAKKEEEFKQKENLLQKQLQARDDEINKKLDEEKKRLQKELQQSIRKSVSADYENQLRLLQQSDTDKEEKLKQARRKELEFLQKEKQLLEKEEELQLQLQRQLLAERNKLKEHLQKEEHEKMILKEQEYQLRMREMEKQLDDQKKLVDEMKRKQEQGSMQLQGEAQELLLEEILQNAFPLDAVNEVPKGKRGADCILVIRNKFGADCGKILFESKRTIRFSSEWIQKLKQDRVNCGAHVAVLVTQVLPDKCDDNFEYKDGVWICSFNDVKILASALRDGIIKISQEARKQEMQGDKIQLLYNYMTSNEFHAQWNAVREVFKNMKQSIDDERRAMEKLWKNREKQLEKALLNSNHIMGSIEGISGKNSFDLNLLADKTELLD